MPRHGCRQASWGHYAPETLYKYVHASDDRGKTWQHVGLPGPMQWPQIFTCASGARLTYKGTAYSNPRPGIYQLRTMLELGA